MPATTLRLWQSATHRSPPRSQPPRGRAPPRGSDPVARFPTLGEEAPTPKAATRHLLLVRPWCALPRATRQRTRAPARPATHSRFEAKPPLVSRRIRTPRASHNRPRPRQARGAIASSSAPSLFCSTLDSPGRACADGSHRRLAECGGRSRSPEQTPRPVDDCPLALPIAQRNAAR